MPAFLTASDFATDAKLEGLSPEELARFAEAACDYVERLTGRRFGTVAYVEYYDGIDDGIVLNQYPVKEVTKVEFLNDDGTVAAEYTSSTSPTLEEKFYLSASTGLLSNRDRSRLPTGLGNIRVSYKAGDVPPTATEAALQIMIKIVNAAETGGDVKMERIGDYAVEYMSAREEEKTGWGDPIDRLLSQLTDVSKQMR